MWLGVCGGGVWGKGPVIGCQAAAAAVAAMVAVMEAAMVMERKTVLTSQIIVMT